MKLGGAVQGIVMSCDVITRWWTTLATRAVKLPIGCDLCGQASPYYCDISRKFVCSSTPHTTSQGNKLDSPLSSGYSVCLRGLILPI